MYAPPIVEDIVNLLVNFVMWSDNRYASLRILPSGSCREGTKVGEHYELDLTLEITDLVLSRRIGYNPTHTPPGELPRAKISGIIKN